MKAPTRNRLRRIATAARATVLALVLVSMAGCYDGEALVERVRNDAMKNRLEEIDLGRYAITMPRDPNSAETVEVEMHLFGLLARYKQDEVEQALEEKEYLLRHETLMAVRESSMEDFTDPDLASIRSRLLAATNALLDEPTIISVGFHEVRFLRH